jgi:PEP-CTERM motif
MRKVVLSLFCAAVAVVSAVPLAKADSFKFVESRSRWTFNDQVYWNELPLDSTVGSGTTVDTQTQKNPVTISFGLGSGQTFTQCGATCTGKQNWDGDFLTGQHLLGSVSSSNSSEGNLTLTFGTPIAGIGFSIQANTFGTFTAEITLFDGSDALGTFFETGNSTSTHGPFATFLGISDLTGADITSVRIAAFDCNGGPCSDGFAINRLLLQTSPQSTTPEPASIALVGLSILAFGFLLRRKLVSVN